MTKTYCTACLCHVQFYDVDLKPLHECKHPKLEHISKSAETPTACPLTIISDWFDKYDD